MRLYSDVCDRLEAKLGTCVLITAGSRALIAVLKKKQQYLFHGDYQCVITHVNTFHTS